MQKEEFLSRAIPGSTELVWIGAEPVEADAWFDLDFETGHQPPLPATDRPVFADAVVTPGSGLPGNFIRINAWPGFLKKNVLEIAAVQPETRKAAEQVLLALGWQFQWVPDTVGMISPRVISMIVNEAYFGLADNISTRDEIDVAMKLGANYPYGPFEWSRMIGLHRIYLLLKQLSRQDERYRVAPLMEEEITALAS